jgi:hypothetical protein
MKKQSKSKTKNAKKSNPPRKKHVNEGKSSVK